jgi:hypothetical protein
LKISKNAEKKYFRHPDVDNNLYNYALHCHAVALDFNRARNLYINAINRMEKNGPDIAFILYSYAIFAFVTHDLDFVDIQMLLLRAKNAEYQRTILNRATSAAKARREGVELKQTEDEDFDDNVDDDDDNKSVTSLKSTTSESSVVKKLKKKKNYPYGRVYKYAADGFFKETALRKNNKESWENFAACRFLVFNDFLGSFDGYLEAIKHDGNPIGEKLKSNFNLMMRFFCGDDEDKIEEVKQKRMQYFAEKDAIDEEYRRVIRDSKKKKNVAAAKIQVFLNFLSY